MTKLQSSKIVTAAFVAAFLAGPGLPVLSAFAAAGENDSFGAAGQEQIIRQAAQGASAKPLSSTQQAMLQEQFRTGQNDAFGARSLPASGLISGAGSRVASSVPMVGASADLVGNHGMQDEVARVIYQTGSGTNF
jgi:hypothetical protein